MSVRSYLSLVPSFQAFSRVNDRLVSPSRPIMTDIQLSPRRSQQVPQAKRQFTSKMPGESIVLKYSKLTDKAYDPIRGTEYAAGFDLRR